LKEARHITGSIHLADVHGDTVRTCDTADGSVASGRRVACWRLRLIRIQGSERQGQLGERDRHRAAWWLLDPSS